jgi:hypothetical protein
VATTTNNGALTNPATWGGSLPSPTDDVTVAHLCTIANNENLTYASLTLSGAACRITYTGTCSITVNGAVTMTGTNVTIAFVAGAANANFTLTASGAVSYTGAGVVFQGASSAGDAGTFTVNCAAGLTYSGTGGSGQPGVYSRGVAVTINGPLISTTTSARASVLRVNRPKRTSTWTARCGTSWTSPTAFRSRSRRRLHRRHRHRRPATCPAS